LGGDPCGALCAPHLTPARCGVRALFASRVLGGAGPRRAGCNARTAHLEGHRLKNSTGVPLAKQAAHAHGTARQAAPSQPGAALAPLCKRRDWRSMGTETARPKPRHARRQPCSPARALRALIATRVTGGPKARSRAASAGTSCQASVSSSASAAKAVMSSRLAFVSSPALASLARVRRAGCVRVCTALSWSIATCV
jgi:hypothetical protein